MNNTPINVRIMFKKVGNLQYVSHLDLVRTMNKIVVRAKLPLWYTEGYNPKPKMVFAAPLSIGTESVCEFMDLRLKEVVDTKQIIEALNKNMTDELVVLDAYYPETKLTELKWLSYVIRVSGESINGAVVEKCNEAFAAESMTVTKKAAVGGAQINLKPLIHSASACMDSSVMRIDCILSADPSSFLNPEYVVKYLREAVGILSSENLLSEGYSIERIAAYRADMTPFR